MKKLTEHKPPNSSLLRAWQVRVNSIYQIPSTKEYGRANSREDGEKYLHRPFIGKIVCDFDFEGVERMVCDTDGSRIKGLYD